MPAVATPVTSPANSCALACRSLTASQYVTMRQRSNAQRIQHLLRRQSTNMAARGRANLLGLAATAEDMEGECGPKAYDAKLLTYEKAL